MRIPVSHRLFLTHSQYIIALVVVMMLSGFTVTQWPDTTPAPWTTQEINTIRSLSLAALPEHSAPGNRYADDRNAIALGKRLFFDNRLSKNGTVSCASCHQPDKHFSDRRTLAMGQAIGKRNTPSLRGVSYNNWFFWDGRKDSLWSQALSPLEDPAEHDFSRTALTRLLGNDPDYLQLYTRTFGVGIAKETVDALSATDDNEAGFSLTDARPSGTLTQIKAWKALPVNRRQQINQVFANAGKALAAYVTTLTPQLSRFDRYASTLKDATQTDQLFSETERRGLRLFISQQSGCLNCHNGPLFSNQSFHNIGSGNPGDSGRAAVISRVKLDRFNCLGQYSDATPEQCRELRFMQTDRHELWGSFKVPGLRNISHTAPYFHDGRYATLAEVLDHYTDTPSADTHLPTVNLSAQDKLALEAFLKTLTAQP